ncbi:hypothetical protein BFJ65_g4547 [Fusarium oxysporum f. sp. cepae]|uniref:Uncharacterized protein n=1 Tax=Fusarium oxysporum f. sp. cepae TaxID=396571 RepID=A0A3L6NU31_FUSOX|nr:hypothetical protein BFJ65_g4547 [Fusarium oxysporum f. sp. cepae]
METGLCTENAVDTGDIYRAMLPFDSRQDRATLEYYAGPAVVVNQRTACFAPTLDNVALIYKLNDGSAAGGLYLNASIAVENQIDFIGTDPSKLGQITSNGTDVFNATICYISQNLPHKYNVTMTGRSVPSEPEFLAEWSTLMAAENGTGILQQLGIGISPDNTRGRGILDLQVHSGPDLWADPDDGMQMLYYDWLPNFNPTREVKTIHAQEVLIPQHWRGFVVVMAIIVAHFVVTALTMVLFAQRTESSLLGNAWQAVSQVVSPDTQDIIRAAGSEGIKDKDMEVLTRSTGRDKEVIALSSGVDSGRTELRVH